MTPNLFMAALHIELEFRKKRYMTKITNLEIDNSQIKISVKGFSYKYFRSPFSILGFFEKEKKKSSNNSSNDGDDDKK